MKNENRQPDPQDQQLEAMLTRALATVTQTPEGFAERVMDASAPLLCSAMDPALETMLYAATHVDVPVGLSDRVMAASLPIVEENSNVGMLLAKATKVEIPVGLADRVMSASIQKLYGESPVIGRIGFTLKMQRLAIAACIIFGVLVAIQMDTTKSTKIIVQHNQLLSVEEEGFLLEDLDLGDYTYLADARELNFTELSSELNGLRQDLELWQYGLLTE